MRRIFGRIAVVLLAATVALGACGDDADSVADRAEDAADRIEDEATGAASDAADEIKEEAEQAFAKFRTGFERLVDEASSGDDAAKEELLDECRDALEDMRENDDPRSEEMGALCQRIRDADNGNAWQEIREEYDELTG